MRAGVVGLILVAVRVASAGPPPPVRVTIECETTGRTKVCPAFLLGFVDANKILLSSPRAVADVVVYATANEIALLDRIHLRFVGKITGAPPVIELDVDIDTRGTDDAQRAQLEPAFLRGIALFVAARHPTAVTVVLTTPDEATVAKPDTTPWGIALSLGGFANYTAQFQNYNGYSQIELTRLERKSRARAQIFGNGGLNRQPPLQVTDDSGNTTLISLDTTPWSIGAEVDGAYLLDACWSVGAASRTWHDDPYGQFRFGWNARAGLEWDKFQADDPRGNRLALLYIAGYQVEGYNLRNVLGERFAQYPIHALIASGSVRKDKIQIGLSLQVSSEVLHPDRRYNISAAPFIDWKIGDHIDLQLNFYVTKRELPGPDPAVLDPMNYAQSSRLSFAEPFAANGSLNLSIHTDRTNGARNDRFSDF
jgi:hypothetical protein